MTAVDDSRIVERELLHHEEALGAGDPEAYRELLAEPATFVLPGMVLGREACIEAMAQAEPWDEFAIDQHTFTRLGTDVALLTYEWRSRRGGEPYAATNSSVYTRTPLGWRLALHQQTPAPPAPDEA